MTKAKNLIISFDQRSLASNPPGQPFTLLRDNGLFERMNRATLNLLKTLHALHRIGKTTLKSDIFVYNNTKHQSTNYSPHYLMLPIDLCFDTSNP